MAAIAGSPSHQDSCHVADEEMEAQGGLSNFFKVAQLESKRDVHPSSSLISESHLKPLCKAASV